MSVSSEYRQSRLLIKTTKEAPAGELSRNAQLLERAGYVRKLTAGVYSYAPLGLRVLAKVEQIIREEMTAIDSEEVLLPALQPYDNWQTTGRAESMKDVLFNVKGPSDRDMTLGPSHEEVVTPLLQSFAGSYKEFPKSVFQIQTKFRNEPRAKSGLLRGREFRMKDMYSFHLSQQDLDEYYERARGAYEKVFNRVGIGDITYWTFASGGAFSQFSHEFQAVTPNGEDTIYVDEEKRQALNKEILEEQNLYSKAEVGALKQQKAIEVGNIFKLGPRFSEAFSFTAQGVDGAQMPIVMGCYGIGSSRLVGSVAEILGDDNGLVWPDELAPYDVHIVPIGGKDRELGAATDLAAKLRAAGTSVLVDDRDLPTGRKLADADLLGMPRQVVIGPRVLDEGKVEVKQRRNGDTEQVAADSVVKALVS